MNVERIAEMPLANGGTILFRHVRPEDEPLIVESIRTASRETLLHRFFSPMRRVSPELLRKMLAIDRTQETCIVGVLEENERQRIVCGARYVRLSADRAQIALTVHDEFQRQGLGRFMLNLIIRMARAEGIRVFEADVMTSNAGMMKLLDRVTCSRRKLYREGDVFHVVIDLKQVEAKKETSNNQHSTPNSQDGNLDVGC